MEDRNHEVHPSAGKTSTSRALFCSCGAIGAFALCLCLVLAVSCAAFFVFYSGEPQGLIVEYELPYSVHVNEEFEFILHLTNDSGQPVQVSDIDPDEVFSGSILDGAVVLSTDPPMPRDYSTPGMKTFALDTTIPPEETVTVRFLLRATSPGEFGGSVGVYVGRLASRVYPVITILE
jgi:hypothetical protein